MNDKVVLPQTLSETELAEIQQGMESGVYLFSQCDLAAVQHAGSQENLKNNFWTYVCGYPYTNTGQFIGRARLGAQGKRLAASARRGEERR